MRRRRAIAGALLALGCWPAMAAAARPVRLTAAFEPGARLGESTTLNAGFHVDPRRLPSPVTSVRVWYPRGIGIVTSGLGLASCVRPAEEFTRVLVDRSIARVCPPNAVLAYGTAHAEVRLLSGQVIPEFATMTVLSGAIGPHGLGLVAFVEGQTPFGARLVYGGEVGAGSGPFGGALTVRVPAIPSIADLATVAMTDMRLSIGSRRIVYYRRVKGKKVGYHPDGVALPSRCPKQGFRFRAVVRFQDGGRATAETAVPCARVAASSDG